jgi:hypothetical protein
MTFTNLALSIFLISFYTMKVSYHNQPVVPPLKVVPSKSSMATLHKSGSNVNLGAEDNPEKG